MFLTFYLISFAIINHAYLICAVAQSKHEPHMHDEVHGSLRFSHQLDTRVDAISPAQFGGQVSWTAMTSGDGTESGKDQDGIWYLSEAIQVYLDRFEKGKRTGVFWAGGATTQEDFYIVYEFAEINLNDNARIIEQVFEFSDFEKMKLDGKNKNNLWWRAMNRISKALAAGATNGVAYVYLKNNNCRTLFSPPSQKPQDNDPTANGQATNGEIFYYAELPMLMRNTNIQQIKTFSKVNRKFVINTEWDVNVDLDKPRDFLPDIAMDATPIILPQAAGRPPLKRDILPNVSNTVSSQGTSPPYPSSGSWRTLSTGTGLPGIHIVSSSNSTTLVNSISHSIAASLTSSTIASSTFVNPPDSSANIHVTSMTSPLSTARGTASSGISINVGTRGPASSGSNIETTLSPGNISTSSLTTSRVSHSSVPSTLATRTVLPGTVPTGSQSKTGSSQPTTTIDSSLALNSPSSSVTTNTTLNPTGAAAKISAQALQNQIIVIGPKIQSYINKPSKEAAQDAINALKGTLPKAQAFSASIGPGSSPKPCGVSTNPITDIFNAATCLTKSINAAVSDIEPGLHDDFSDIDKVTSDLSDLKDLHKPLGSDSEEEDDDEPSQSQDSQTPSSTRLSTTASSSTSSRSQSCSDFRTVSDCHVSCPRSASCSTTCYSTSAGCSATGTTSTTSESAAACAFNTASDVPSQTIPLAAFVTTAWWDYGISCAGSCTDFTLPSSSVSSNGDLTVSLASSNSNRFATTGRSMTLNSAMPTMTSVHSKARLASSVPSSSAGALTTTTALKSSSTQASMSASADPVTSTAAQSAAAITQSPICVPGENTGGGNGGVENCLDAAFCECSSGNSAGTYVTMSTGSNMCGYTIYPASSLTWDPSDQVCTLGLSASVSSASAMDPAPVATKGQIIYTKTQLPISGAGTTVLGCTSTSTGPGPAGFESTACVGSTTPLTTIFPPVKTPTGDPVPPTCNKACDPQDAPCQGDSTGYVPNTVFFEAAIGVVCGPACPAGDRCYSFTDRLLIAGGTESLVSSFKCSTLQTAPGGNSSLDCEPRDWEHNPPPYWSASGIAINMGVKLLDKSCQWKIDSDTCKKYLGNSLTGCPAGGMDSVECVAWTVGAGAASLSVGDWAKLKVPT